MIVRLQKTTQRRGTIVPMMALCTMALLGMIALAVDVGLIAVARTQAQNAADIAALSGARALNGDSTTSYNIASSVATAKAAATNNKILNQYVSNSEVTMRTGVYRYNTTLQRFIADPASFTSTASGTPSGAGTWTASEATINVNQPTYFARVFGINTFNVNVQATAVHRPRDIAIVLDFSGSMRFSSTTHWPDSGNVTGSLNPDPVWPKFGHYSRYVGVATTGANPMQRTTNFTMGSGENLAPNNLTVETSNGPPVIGTLGNASKQYFLHKTSGGGFASAWNFDQGTGYNPNYSPVAMPAPDNFEDDLASGYVGDKQPRKGKATSGSNWAAVVREYLENVSTTYSNTHARSDITGPGGGPFDRRSGTTSGYGPDFKGYSMGPGYYGKTFWMWPPDPREPVGDPTTSDYVPGDWRQRYFYYDTLNANAGKRVDDNSILFDSNGYVRQPSTATFAIDYNAVLKWISSGPTVFPSNLRAGRLVYYSAIPTTIPATGGTLDQVFWRNYINYVLMMESSNGGQRTLYGRESNNWQVNTKITAKANLRSFGDRSNTTDPAPYMHYNDNPKRPRSHFWFGPLTMLMFIAESNETNGIYDENMWPGTCSEAQTWQLKAGVQSALDDIKINHPNDWVSLIYFSHLAGFNTPRVKLGQDYSRMKNALWFPYTLLNSLGDPNSEIRPYNSSYGYTAGGNVPNARGTTCPDMGFKLAYNEFSMASGYNGRRGASKMVIFETDGVPNTTCGGTLGSGSAYYSTYGSASQIGTTNYVNNGDPGVISAARNTVKQITKLDDNSNRGYSTTRTPARVHAIAFGDLFQTSTTMKDTALTFLTNVQIDGKTQSAGATSLEPYKIIVGNYNTRIDNLRIAFERIMQSGVQVTLIK